MARAKIGRQVVSQHCIKKTGATSGEVRYCISSPDTSPAKMNQVIRLHWRVENNLHWVLDLVFNEDNSLKKKDNSAINFNVVTKVALALLEKEQSMKASKKREKTKCGAE